MANLKRVCLLFLLAVLLVACVVTSHVDAQGVPLSSHFTSNQNDEVPIFTVTGGGRGWKLEGASSGYVIEGRVKVEGMATKFPWSKTSNIKVVLNGGQKVTFIRSDGYFAFQGVTAGTHLLEVVAIGYYFSPVSTSTSIVEKFHTTVDVVEAYGIQACLVRVDVSARLHGQVKAVAVETRRGLADGLVLEPLKEEFYYERREPFSVVSLLKSPMGLMVGFMLVAVFLLPKLMDSIDPEEMKRVQEEMRNQPAPSFSNLLQGRS